MNPEEANFRYFIVKRKGSSQYYTLSIPTTYSYLFKVGNGYENDGLSPGWLGAIDFTYEDAVEYGKSLVNDMVTMSALRSEASQIKSRIVDRIFADYNAQERAKKSDI